MIFQVGSILLRRIAVCAAGAIFVLACGQGAALRSAQEAGETVKAQTQPRAESGNQNSTGVVKEISLAELSAMNKASTKGTASGKGTTSGKVAKPLPQGAATSGTAGTATRSSGAAANSSGMSVPAPRTTVPGSGSSTGVSRTSARGVGPDLGVTKDITGLERVVLKGGNGKILTQAMMNQRCRRYIIEGTFDLAGKAVTMPYGSVLDLENGELRNGGLVMDQTRVTPIYGISKETRISKVKVSGEYYETLVDLWGVHEDPVFPWDTSAPKKVYVVDLKKFGITPGYQRKGADGHYTDRQYDLMYQNGVGFTEAIQWAYKNGYDGIRFPKNDYCFTPRTVGEKKPSGFCGQVLIQDLIKFDIDLGGGSYYNILDSSRKSKYYKAEGESYQQTSTMFWMAMCINVTIRNGKLIGDRTLRDYCVSKENAQESSKGIMISAYCYSIRVKDIEFSGFMNDGLTTSQTGNFFETYESTYSSPGTKYVSLAKKTKYNNSKGHIIVEDNNAESCYVTDYIDLTKRYNKDFEVMRLLKDLRWFTFNNNRGYTRIPNSYLNVQILTFDANVSTDTPLRIISTSYLDHFQLAPEETGVKVQFFYDDGVVEDGIIHKAAISDLISGNCIVEKCSFCNNHRGGISGGCNSMTIRNCHFMKNDKEKNHSGKIIPLFSVAGTNYHIDFEDSFAKDLIIYGCSFERTKETIGKILLGVLSFDFCYNKSDVKVSIYNNIVAEIHHNHFLGPGIGFNGWLLSKNVDNQNIYGCKYLNRVTLLHDNIIQMQSMANLPYRTVLLYY